LLGRDEVFPKGHRLDELWRVCVAVLQEVASGGGDEVQQTTRLMGEFCRVDSTSEAFRYPVDKSGNRSLPDGPEIDLTRARDVVGKMSFFLDCVSTHVSALEENSF
jgi:hypothetical protein